MLQSKKKKSVKKKRYLHSSLPGQDQKKGGQICAKKDRKQDEELSTASLPSAGIEE